MSILPDGRGGSKEYSCKKTERVLINSTDTLHLSKLGLRCERLELENNRPQRDARSFIKVSSVQMLTEKTEVFSIIERERSRITVNGLVVSSS